MVTRARAHTHTQKHQEEGQSLVQEHVEDGDARSERQPAEDERCCPPMRHLILPEVDGILSQSVSVGCLD